VRMGGNWGRLGQFERLPGGRPKIKRQKKSKGGGKGFPLGGKLTIQSGFVEQWRDTPGNRCDRGKSQKKRVKKGKKGENAETGGWQKGSFFGEAIGEGDRILTTPKNSNPHKGRGARGGKGCPKKKTDALKRRSRPACTGMAAVERGFLDGTEGDKRVEKGNRPQRNPTRKAFFLFWAQWTNLFKGGKHHPKGGENIKRRGSGKESPGMGGQRLGNGPGPRWVFTQRRGIVGLKGQGPRGKNVHWGGMDLRKT